MSRILHRATPAIRDGEDPSVNCPDADKSIRPGRAESVEHGSFRLGNMLGTFPMRFVEVRVETRRATRLRRS